MRRRQRSSGYARHTFGAGLACRVALNLRHSDDLLPAIQRWALFPCELNELAAKACVKEVRGFGLMLV